MHIKSSISLLFLAEASNLVQAFAPSYKGITVHQTTSLDAKAKKKKKATTTSTGGFGTVVEKKTPKKQEASDYDAFPALEASVKETLVASSVEDRENAKDLSNEMYDRLGHIYGFKDFNFPPGWFDDEEKESNEEESSMSFDDLISGGSPKPSSSSSDFGDLLKSNSDFDDLIAGASGGSVSSPSSKSTPSKLSEEQLKIIENLPSFSKFRVLHVDPMVLAIDDFFTSEECDKYVDLCANPEKRTSNNDAPMMSRSKTVGKDSLAKAQRTSTTWFHHFKSVPELMSKASRLIGLRDIDRWEEPQTVRYQQTEKFTWHLDALAPSDDLESNGGQRVATLLVYLTDVGENNGGSTVFRDLNGAAGDYLKVQPKKGSALLFFPAAGGVPKTPFDIRTLHAGEALSSDAPADKWIAQLWLRENNSYVPTAPPGNTHVAAKDAITEFCNMK
ncbi:hypothetical protein CTEN210_05624 [Chaetoceros tenuissimus]|uniref:Fe2OG dioxygenase domain-containing protein n=1 Tax=Chaetoceros tenuissimus TaxID=426638 RepID=A0AAD3CND5_9STRA|nr:hypothetical protein CTEN210_05624 [Chaetoceros tenuissimus]